jgi:hypothetical protein
VPRVGTVAGRAQLDLLELAARKRRRSPAADPAEMIDAAMDEMNRFRV